jgi:hypothetical protein
MSKGKPPKQISRGLIQPKSELMGAVTIATISKPREGMKSLRLNAPTLQELIECVNGVMDHVVIAILLDAAGPFAWLQPELPTVICSPERAEHYGTRVNILPIKTPWRSNEYPRELQSVTFVEPFLEENNLTKLNPLWEQAPFELEIWSDPSKCFLDLLPIEAFRNGDKFSCILTYAFTGLDDAIRAVVLKREAKLVDIPVTSET